MSPDSYEQLKQVASIVGPTLGAAVAAWKLAMRKSSRDHTPAYQGTPDDSPRKISRLEWHKIVNTVNNHGLKLDGHDHQIEIIVADVARLDRADETRGMQIAKILESTIRTEEQFSAHRGQWADAGKRAEEDRRELTAAVRELGQKVDRLAEAR